MKKIFLLLLLFSLQFLVSCRKNEDVINPAVSASAHGIIAVDAEAIPGALVTLTGNPDKSIYTNVAGVFQFNGLPNGSYSLKIEGVLNNGSTLSQTLGFNINYNNADLGTIRFATPPVITAIDTVSMANTAIVKWKKSTDQSFLDYLVYQSTTSLFDESSGELVYKSTNITDTAFSDNTYKKGVTKYYRVYVHTNSARIYGGTIEGVNTPPKNFIINGGFEASLNGRQPDSWRYVNQGIPDYDYMYLSTAVTKSGSKSCVLAWTDSIAQYSHSGTLYQRISMNGMVAGKRYKLSFWMKSDTGRVGLYFYRLEDFTYFEIPGGQDWTEKTFSFELTKSVTSMRIELISSQFSGKRLKGYIDDISLMEE
ncbi:MAG: carbohydrate binding domain-containing protein [Ignavibacteria bacterium]